MRWTFDDKVAAGYLEFSPATPTSQEEFGGLILDLAGGELVGIEILGAVPIAPLLAVCDRYGVEGPDLEMSVRVWQMCRQTEVINGTQVGGRVLITA